MDLADLERFDLPGLKDASRPPAIWEAASARTGRGDVRAALDISGWPVDGPTGVVREVAAGAATWLARRAGVAATSTASLRGGRPTRARSGAWISKPAPPRPAAGFPPPDAPPRM